MQCLSRQKSACLDVPESSEATSERRTFFDFKNVLDEFAGPVILEPKEPLVAKARRSELEGCHID